MQNLIKFSALVIIAFVVFWYTGNNEFSMPNLNIPDITLPEQSTVIQNVKASFANFAAPAVNSTAIVENADLYNGLKLRTKPNRNAIILRSLKDGTRLQILKYDASKDWAFVETETGTQGWVYATGYLRIAESYQLATY